MNSRIAIALLGAAGLVVSLTLIGSDGGGRAERRAAQRRAPAAADTDETPDDNGAGPVLLRIRGRTVLGADSVPIGGCTVRSGDSRTESDSSGVFRLDVSGDPAEAVTVRVSGAGLGPRTVHSRRTGLLRDLGDITLRGTAELPVRIETASGMPVASAELGIALARSMRYGVRPDLRQRLPAEFRVLARTDDKGVATLSELPANVHFNILVRDRRGTNHVVGPAMASMASSSDPPRIFRIEDTQSLTVRVKGDDLPAAAVRELGVTITPIEGYPHLLLPREVSLQDGWAHVVLPLGAYHVTLSSAWDVLERRGVRLAATPVELTFEPGACVAIEVQATSASGSPLKTFRMVGVWAAPEESPIARADAILGPHVEAVSGAHGRGTLRCWGKRPDFVLVRAARHNLGWAPIDYQGPGAGYASVSLGQGATVDAAIEGAAPGNALALFLLELDGAGRRWASSNAPMIDRATHSSGSATRLTACGAGRYELRMARGGTYITLAELQLPATGSVRWEGALHEGGIIVRSLDGSRPPRSVAPIDANGKVRSDLIKGTVDGKGVVHFRALPSGDYALGYEWDLADAALPHKAARFPQSCMRIRVANDPVPVAWHGRQGARTTELRFVLPEELQGRHLLTALLPVDGQRRLPAWANWTVLQHDASVVVGVPNASEVLVVLAAPSATGGREAWGITPVYCTVLESVGSRVRLEVPEPGTVTIAVPDRSVSSAAISPRTLAESGFRWFFVAEPGGAVNETDLLAAGPLVAVHVQNVTSADGHEGRAPRRQHADLAPGAHLRWELRSGGEELPDAPVGEDAPFGLGRK